MRGYQVITHKYDGRIQGDEIVWMHEDAAEYAKDQAIATSNREFDEVEFLRVEYTPLPGDECRVGNRIYRLQRTTKVAAVRMTALSKLTQDEIQSLVQTPFTNAATNLQVFRFQIVPKKRLIQPAIIQHPYSGEVDVLTSYESVEKAQGFLDYLGRCLSEWFDGACIVNTHSKREYEATQPNAMLVCSECMCTNVGLINLNSAGKQRWVCYNCCKNAMDHLTMLLQAAPAH